MSPTPKRIRASKWQTDLLITLHTKSPQPSRAQIDKISDETGLEEAWIKHWFRKRTASSKKPLPAVSSAEKKIITRSSSVPISTSVPRTTIQPGDIYVHDPVFYWDGSPASRSDDNANFVPNYDTQDRGHILFEIPSANLHSHAQSHDQDQAAVQSQGSISKPNYVFTTPLQPQHYPNQAQASQKSRAMSPSLGYIPSTFPMSIFTDSPEKQLQNVKSTLGADSNQNTSTQFPAVPTVQDPYSIRFPSTYSPRRRRGPSPSFFDTLHQQSQPQPAYNFNYGYDIPSESSFSASLQAQSTSVHSQSHAPLVPIAGSGRYPSQAPHQPIPIAYTARLTDLTAFALNMKNPRMLALVGTMCRFPTQVRMQLHQSRAISTRK